MEKVWREEGRNGGDEEERTKEIKKDWKNKNVKRREKTKNTK